MVKRTVPRKEKTGATLKRGEHPSVKKQDKRECLPLLRVRFRVGDGTKNITVNPVQMVVVVVGGWVDGGLLRGGGRGIRNGGVGGYTAIKELDTADMHTGKDETMPKLFLWFFLHS